MGADAGARTDPTRRLVALLGLVVAMVAVLSALWATSAHAHAVLTESDPSDGATLDGSPGEISLRFNEPVSLDLGGVTVLDVDGNEVQEGDARQVDGAVVVDVADELDTGTYLVNYRVVSDDGHPVSGAVVFGVGVAPDATSVAGLASETEPGWGLWAGLGRLLVYLGTLLAVGAAFFFAFFADPAVPLRPLRWLVPAAAATAAMGIPVLVVANAARGSGQGWDVLGDGDLLRSALGQGLEAMVVLVVLALVLAVAASLLGGSRLTPTAHRALAGASVVVAAAGFVQWGHVRAAEPRWLATAGDVVHVMAGAVWIGGVVVLAWLLVAKIGEPAPLARTLARFSTGAAVLVVLVAVGGGAMASTQLEEPSDLWASDYGQVLATKLAVVGLVLVLAGVNRWRLLPGVLALASADGTSLETTEDHTRVDDDSNSKTGSSEAEASASEGADRAAESPVPSAAVETAWTTWTWLRVAVAAEAVLLVLVVLATTVLVDTTPPGREGGVPAGAVAFQGQAEVGDATLMVDLLPGQVGFNELHLLYLGDDGALADVAETVTVEFVLPELDLGPISGDAFRLSGGHFLYEGTEMSVAGEWEVTVVSRVSRFEEERSTFTVPVG